MMPSQSATDADAAAEMPHRDLNRAEAADLLTTVFGDVLEEPSGIYDDLDVEKYNSDFAAVVIPTHPGAGGEGEPAQAGLLTSTLPLRDENAAGERAPVDLDLRYAEGELQPHNPLVEVGIPAEIDQGISLPEVGITIDLVSAPAERAPSNLEGNAAFYPNVAPDSDLTVQPTPLGFETQTVLRTTAAPHTQRFELTLPATAQLEATNDGGAAVTKGEETLLAVRPPTAVDAEGDSVPVTLEASGDAIVLHVSPGEGDALPILVDPVYESYSWMNTNTTTGLYSDWLASTGNESVFKPAWLGVWSQTLHFGMNLHSYYGAIAPNTWATWYYRVPRYFSDYADPAVSERPTSFIRGMTLSQVYFLVEEAPPVHPHPLMYALIWDEYKGEFVALGAHSSAEGNYSGVTIPLANPLEVTDAKLGGIALATGESMSYPRQAFVGAATVELSDKDAPGFLNLGSASGWLNDAPSAPINYIVSDPGLGIYQLQVQQPSAAGGTTQITTSANCVGNASQPCPRTLRSAERTLNYAPATMPQGEHWLKVTATDPIGQKSSVGEPRVKVDHTAPSLALSGSLTEQATVGTKLAQYSLKLDAADGDSAPASALSPLSSQGTAQGKLERPQGIAVDAAGNIWVADNLNNRVTKFDPDGNFLKQIGTGSANGQVKDPRGIAISPNGTVWVADSGNKRLQAFNSSGEFIRNVTYPWGFKELWGVATGPGGVVWAVDRGAGGVFKFSEDGTYLWPIAYISGPGVLSQPIGAATDRQGNVWVADLLGNRVVEYDSTGKYVSSLGSAGAGNGQFNYPIDVAFTPSGNLLVTDRNNHRVQEFEVDGTYLRQFGTIGSVANQLNEPLGVATAPGGVAYVADGANHRIARWSHADFNPQSGVKKVLVKVDGGVEYEKALSCESGGCAVPELLLNSDFYSIGQHELEVIATDGVELPTPRKLAFETHGDHAAPSVALSGSMTEQASLGTTRPTYRLNVSATDPGGAEERQAGAATTIIKFDGQVVDSYSPGCSPGGCSISREWTLKSDEKSVGSHAVQVIATDAANHMTTKTLTINIARDTTAPQLTATGPLIDAPEGWVQQETLGLPTVATDVNGYGVKQIQLKIDGQVVSQNFAFPCEAGGCQRSKAFSVNTANYEGGAHSAEVVVIDWAGNVAKLPWTMNVDPAGVVTSKEAEATLEALDETSGANTIGAASEEPEYEGTASGLEFAEEPSELVAEGSLTPVVLEEAEGGATMAVQIPESTALEPVCTNPEEAEPEKEPTGLEEEEQAADPPSDCIPEGTSELATEPRLEDLRITPIDAGGISEIQLTGNDAAAVSPNLTNQTDLVTRPLLDGAMTFTAIRDAAAPGTYSWRVQLEPEQQLKLIDPEHALVYYDDNHAAFSISVVQAHDAIGSTVPTSLSVTSPDIVTLSVSHRAESPAGGAFVYPVIAGAGWQGGFQTYQVEMPPGEFPEEPNEEIEGGYGEFTGMPAVKIVSAGPPMSQASGAPQDELQPAPAEAPRLEKKFKFTYCYPHNIPGDPLDGQVPVNWWNKFFSQRPNDLGKNLPQIVSECHREDFNGVYWGVSAAGKFHYVFHHWVWIFRSQWDCRKWGEEEPAKVHCSARFFETRHGPANAVHGPIHVVGMYRFHPGKGHWPGGDVYATCFVQGGELYPNPRKAYDDPYERPMIWEREGVSATGGEVCHWPNLLS